MENERERPRGGDATRAEDDSGGAAALRRVGGVLRTVALADVLVFFGSLLDPHNPLWLGVLVHGPVLAILLVAALWLRAGHPARAGWAISSAVWLLVTFSMFAFGGLTGGANAVGYLLVVMIAGATIHTQAAWLFAWLSVGMATVVLVVERMGWLPQAIIPYTPFNAWLGIVAVILLGAYLHRSVVDALNDALFRSRGAAERLRRTTVVSDRRARHGERLGLFGARLQEIREGSELWSEVQHTIEDMWPGVEVRAWIRRHTGSDGREVFVPRPRAGAPSAEVDVAAIPDGGRARSTFVLPAEVGARLCARAEGPVWAARLGGSSHPVGYLVVASGGVRQLAPDELLFLGTLADMAATAQARIDAEVRAIQAQKLEIVGRLAGGVAHDFNNLITAIMAISEELRALVGARPEVRDALEILDAATERATLVTSQLLAFGRRRSREVGPSDLARVVRELVPMLGRLLPDEHVVRVDLPAEPMFVAPDRASLEQVVLNLVINASEAIGRESVEIRVEVRRGEHGGVLRVRDDGAGMDASTRDRLFEPFFTTKRDGTGLGLAIVSDVVAEAGGAIRVDSRLGQGSEFVVELPETRNVRAPARRPRREAPKLRAGTRVLLVEDHDLVRRGLERMLESVGCEVVGVASGEEALGVVATDVAFDLLLTDMHMPGGTGEALARDPTVVKLGIPVLITSGDTELNVPREEGGAPRAFLGKPFSREELVAVLEDLQRRSTPGTGPSRRGT